MKKYRIFIILFCLLILPGCGQEAKKNTADSAAKEETAITNDTPSTTDSKASQLSGKGEGETKKPDRESGKAYPSKTPIKDFIENYFAQNSYSQEGHYFDVNKKNDDLFIKTDYLRCDPLSWDPWEVPCIYRKDNFELWKILEGQLATKFNIARIDVTYENRKKLVTEFMYDSKGPYKLYENHKFVYEPVLEGISADGKFAQIYLLQGCPGKCETEKENGSFIFNMIDDSAFDENEVKKLIRYDYGKGDTFFESEISYDDETILTGYFVPEKAQEDTGMGGALKTVFRHKTTGIEMPVQTHKITEHAEHQGFLGHPLMKGLILLSSDKLTCYLWNNADILKKDELDQKLAELYNAVAMHYYDKKEYQTGVDYFDKAIKIQLDYAQAYFNKACAQALLNQPDAAIASLKKAIELEPKKFREKTKTDPDLAGLKDNKDFQAIID